MQDTMGSKVYVHVSVREKVCANIDGVDRFQHIVVIIFSLVFTPPVVLLCFDFLVVLGC